MLLQWVCIAGVRVRLLVQHPPRLDGAGEWVWFVLCVAELHTRTRHGSNQVQLKLCAGLLLSHFGAPDDPAGLREPVLLLLPGTQP